MILLVLCRVCELKRATSREVADSAGLCDVKYVSLVLTRCMRRGFVDRKPYSCGREHGYVYWLTNKGAEWVLRKADSRIEAFALKTSQAESKKEVASKSEDADLTPSSVVPTFVDAEARKRLYPVFCFLQLKNETFELENQELNSLLGITRTAYCKCSSERDYSDRQCLSLKRQLERIKEEFQSLSKLLEEKDKMILDLMQYIIESGRRSKLPNDGLP